MPTMLPAAPRRLCAAAALLLSLSTLASAAVVYPLSSVLPGPPPADAAGNATCGPGQQPSSVLAPPALLGSEDFEADRCATLLGHMARFTLRPTGPGSDGIAPATLHADSLDLLELRVLEMDAVRRLRAMGSTETAGGAAAASLRQTGSAVAGVVTRPVESVIGLPAGALRFFGRRAGTTRQRVVDVGEQAIDAFTDEAAFDASLRPREASPPPAEPEPWWKKSGSVASRLGKRWLGYNAARRELGERLGVDPYSSNPWLAAEMDRLAWAALVGRRGVGLGLGQVGGIAGATLGGTGRIHRMVWDNPPEDVTAWNAGRMAPLACSEQAREAFLDNARYSPTLQTRAVDALLDLVPQQGCDPFLTLAASVEREAEARYVVDLLQLLSAAQPRFPTRFEAVGDAIVLRDGLDRLWLALPVDLLQWTPETAEFFGAPAFDAIDQKRALLGREASPLARAALLERGWTVVEQAMGPARERAAQLASASTASAGSSLLERTNR